METRVMWPQVTLSGDVTIDNAGVSAIGASKVLSSMVLDGTNRSRYR
jgi:hypothetical protein